MSAAGDPRTGRRRGARRCPRGTATAADRARPGLSRVRRRTGTPTSRVLKGAGLDRVSSRATISAGSTDTFSNPASAVTLSYPSLRIFAYQVPVYETGRVTGVPAHELARRRPHRGAFVHKRFGLWAYIRPESSVSGDMQRSTASEAGSCFHVGAVIRTVDDTLGSDRVQ